MHLTNSETQKILTAASADEVFAVLSSAEDLASWDGAEPITDHSKCIFDALSEHTQEERDRLCAMELSVTPSEKEGMIRVEFTGELNDEELENVSAAGSCLEGMPIYEGVLKPVIYLYPEIETDVTVEICQERMKFTCVYPEVKDGRWTVTARPDGTLISDGKEYSYLYWEGETPKGWADTSRGFCVAGGETAAFLEKSLAALGLNRKEANEMIVYWLPLLQKNPWNLISFQFENYAAMAPLSVDPAPDTVIRVYMVCRPLEKPVEIEPQELSAPERRGFTVVEWGGTI